MHSSVRAFGTTTIRFGHQRIPDICNTPVARDAHDNAAHRDPRRRRVARRRGFHTAQQSESEKDVSSSFRQSDIDRVDFMQPLLQKSRGRAELQENLKSRPEAEEANRGAVDDEAALPEQDRIQRLTSAIDAKRITTLTQDDLSNKLEFMWQTALKKEASSEDVSSSSSLRDTPDFPLPGGNGSGRRLQTIKGHIWSLRDLSRESRTAHLTHQMMDYYYSHTPTQFVDIERSKTIKRVQDVIRSKFGPSWTVKPFGSTIYGVSSRDSDLDLVMLDEARPNGLPPPKSRSTPPEYNATKLGKLLHSNRFDEIKAVPFASVPIVKFRDPDTGIQCDICINERLGLINSQMLARYMYIAPVLKPLLVVIKAWARRMGYNDPTSKNGRVSFSSYTLTLMTIAMLQHTHNLPNLQGDLVPSHPEGPRDYFWYRKRKTELIKCDVRFNRSRHLVPRHYLSPAQALKSWFQFWADEFDYGNQLVSVRQGGVVERQRTSIYKDWSWSPSEELLQKGIITNRYDRRFHTVPLHRRLEKAAASDTGGLQRQSTPEMDAFFGNDDRLRETDSAGVHKKNKQALPVSDEGLEMDTGEQRGVALEAGVERRAKREGEPHGWENHFLVVADPFIRTKNLAARISVDTITDFRRDCLRAYYDLIRNGEGLNKILPPEPIKRSFLKPRDDDPAFKTKFTLDESLETADSTMDLTSTSRFFR